MVGLPVSWLRCSAAAKFTLCHSTNDHYPLRLKNDGDWAPFLQSSPVTPQQQSSVTIEASIFLLFRWRTSFLLCGQEWLDVWGLLVGGAKKLSDLPMWLQYYPKTLFDTINRSGSGVVSKQELRLFFTGQFSVNE